MAEGAFLPDVIAHWARVRPDSEAIVEVDGPRVSYGRLGAMVSDAARALSAAGLRAGDRVAFAGPPGLAFVVTMAATHRAGGVWLGLNPRYTATEVRDVLRRSSPRLLCVASEVEASVRGAIHEALSALDLPPALLNLGPSLEGLNAHLPLADGPLASDLDDVALLVFTSGTTGVPKGALLTHAGLREASRLYAEAYGLENARFLNNLPVNHVGAVVDICASAMASGAAMICMRGFEPDRIAAIAKQEALTHLGQIPSMYALIEEHGALPLEHLPALQWLIWSGAAAPRSLIERYFGRGPTLSTCYGLTEITGSITFTHRGARVEQLANTIGAPISESACRLDPEGEAGAQEIQVRGPLAFAGYLNDAAATKAAFTADGWLRTGDLARLNGDGAYILSGRTKEMFKSGGYNVYPREVELALEAHPAVAVAIVVARKDELWGEVGEAFILRRDSLQEEELIAFARARLANYKIPKRVHFVAELPYLPNGKIDRRALGAQALQFHERGA